jgi:hypothetical protein
MKQSMIGLILLFSVVVRADGVGGCSAGTCARWGGPAAGGFCVACTEEEFHSGSDCENLNMNQCGEHPNCYWDMSYNGTRGWCIYVGPLNSTAH